jgi:DNA-binding PadR family transcriptional regulator
MSLRHAALAALLAGEASGYDLAKSFSASVGNFWVATPQQLYRELERLESEGLITGRLIEQQRRPNKRLFSLTPAGRQALADYTRTPSRDTSIKDELLVKVQAVDVGDAAAVADALRQRLEAAQSKLRGYETLRTRMLDGRDEQAYLTGNPEVGPYLTLLRGMRFEKENIAWARQALRVLQSRSGMSAARIIGDSA